MEKLTYRLVEGSSELFEIVREDTSVGIVWERGGRWFADTTQMSLPSHEGPTRSAVAEALSASLTLITSTPSVRP